MFDEMNYQSTVREDVDTESMEFIKLRELVDKGVKEILVDGFFFSSGKYGKGLVVVGNGYKINFPSHAISKFEAIANDPAKLQAVLDHKLIIKNFESVDTGKGNPTMRFTLADVK